MKGMRKESEKSENGSIDSPSVDNHSYNNGVLRKGPWTSEEDDILMAYVREHGEGNWNAVHKNSVLARCGKSCRLRWINHLRPDLKKGPFSPEEERLVVELHAKMGNKWSRMAPELPGRTDNEIKNFWNTRLKRRKKSGLPIYPPDICRQVQNENQQGDEVDSCLPENVYPLPVNSIEIPMVEFKYFDQNRYSSIHGDIPSINLPEIHTGGILVQGFQTPYSLTGSYSTNALSKDHCGSDMFTFGNQSSTDGFLQSAPSLGFSSPYDHNSGFLSIAPSSQPSYAMKLELSSFQNQMDSWGSPWPSSLPEFENSSIQTEKKCILPSLHNNGLLEASPYASKTVSKAKNSNFHWDSLASKMVATQSNQELHLGHSPSVFCDSPLVSCNTFDELQPMDVLPPVKEETGITDQVLGNEKINATSSIDFKDNLKCVESGKHLMNGYLLGTFADESKKFDTGEASQPQFHNQDACAWNASACSLLCRINSTEAQIRTEIEQFFAIPAAWDGCLG